jgi:hypothetical protein
MLIVFYLIALYKQLPVLTFNVLIYWLAALLMQALVVWGATDVGYGFYEEIAFWVCMFQHCSSGKNASKHVKFRQHGGSDAFTARTQLTPRWEIYLRLCFSLIVNCIYRTLIIITLGEWAPSTHIDSDLYTDCCCLVAFCTWYLEPNRYLNVADVLSRSTDHMDFVLNSFAIFFVAALDDIGDAVELDIDFDEHYDKSDFGT